MLRTAALCCLLLSACASRPDAAPRWSAAPVSSPQFESHPMFDPTTRDLYFTRSNPDLSGSRLYVSACGPRRQRQAPQLVPFAGGDGADADPFITPDGGELWFTSTRSLNGLPKTDRDIWRVVRSAGGAWGPPQRLPPPINSEASEWFPRINADDGWLYFGSNRAGGAGGADIYRAQADGVGGWRVENLGPNINTSGDEYEAEFSTNGRRMILMADGDLYAAEKRDQDRWRQRERLGDDVNTPAMEIGPLLSLDGRALLFARDSGDPALTGEIYQRGASNYWPPRCRD
jgi:hypothetical protein